MELRSKTPPEIFSDQYSWYSHGGPCWKSKYGLFKPDVQPLGSFSSYMFDPVTSLNSRNLLRYCAYLGDFKILASKREAETRLLNARLTSPLQKSVSTPSIIAVPLVTVNDLETDPFLGLQDDEPDSWTPTVSKEIVRKLKEKEIKRQEHLYEFILTEKHHCLTLRVMQKVFVEGLKKYLNLGATVDRMFPRINDLVELHLAFLHKLRTRQKDNPVIDNIGNILLEQFGGPAGAALKSVYGEFCSNHRNAIDIYKYYMQSDTRFAEFVKHCQANPLLKKKGIPECILFVTQRLTKYPLLIEPLIKTMKDNKDEQEKLVKALTLVKEILVEVDAQVAEKEKEDRKLEIYNRVEAKSFTTHKGLKFKKSDILDEKRKLRFEGIAMLMQGRGKMQVVLVIVFSDVLCFLLENNHKYSFFTPENKAGVVSLQKLLVREKAGQESRGIYLISSNPAEPEMFELKVHKPKDKQVWIKAISLEAEVAILKSHSGDIGKPAYRHNHQLEELRNLQDKLQSERELWQKEKESEMKELQQKRDEIAKLQEQVKHDQVDLVQQRSQLFRKLDVLSSRGVIVNSTLSVSSSSSSDDPSCLPTAPSTDPPKKKNDPSKWKPPTNGKVASLPLNLISATNQQKVSPGVQVRQQLPLKLASKLGGSCGSSPASPSSSLQQLLPLKLREDASEAKKPTADSPTQLTAHLRTGSSPAMMQNIPVSDEE
ncbi:unnamed protein product [Nesidiocoris tenuis]|uniref:DH domain-containing protein n=1 Tax=Nesidiocoris tenuis TaxID=355587 RepID=A0A6H5H284_9HEMI|nr:unnamed protein product [Nesidiocoris tenuis]